MAIPNTAVNNSFLNVFLPLGECTWKATSPCCWRHDERVYEKLIFSATACLEGSAEGMGTRSPAALWFHFTAP